MCVSWCNGRLVRKTRTRCQMESLCGYGGRLQKESRAYRRLAIRKLDLNGRRLISTHIPASRYHMEPWMQHLWWIVVQIAVSSATWSKVPWYIGTMFLLSVRRFICCWSHLRTPVYILRPAVVQSPGRFGYNASSSYSTADRE